MTLAEIYAALDPDRPAPGTFSACAGPIAEPIAVRSALALLTPMIGLPLAAIDLPPPSFSIRFPKEAIPAEAAQVFGRKLSRYRAWRRTVLDSQLLATWRVVDDDPWDALRRVTRLLMGKLEADALYALSSRMPGLGPGDLTLERVMAIQDKLSGRRRAPVRRACTIVDRLHDHALATALGILPPRLGPLPRMPRLRDHLPLPPRLARFAAGAGPGIEAAVTHCWTLAVRAGLLPAAADPDPGAAFPPAIWSKLAAADPSAHGVALAAGTVKIYRQRLSRALIAAGAPDPRADPAGAAWSTLKAAVRRTGRHAEVLSAISVPAMRDSLGPVDLTPEWFAALLAGKKDRQQANAARTACFLLDELHGEPGIPDELLPGQPTGIIRRRAERASQAPEPEPAPNPVRQTWADFLSAARAEGVPEEQLTLLASLGRRAERRAIFPADLNAPTLEGLCRRSTRAERAALAEALDALRLRPALAWHLAPEPVGPIGARKPGRGLTALDPDVAAEVDALLVEQGAAESTGRAARAAVAALCRAAAAQAPFDSLDDLLRLDPDVLDWSRDADRADAHRQVIGGLRSFRSLAWTPAWRALQHAAVEAGIARAENPVPFLLSVADGREPPELDKAWARAIDRRHRAVGRADLARTFEANLARLDRLHAYPTIAATELLPPVFGPLRERAELLPLPGRLSRMAEAHGCGAAAGTVWTIAVAAGLIAADDDPGPATLADPAVWQRLGSSDPADHGLPIARATFESHCRQVAHMLDAAGLDDPRRTAADLAWAALAAAVRETGRNPNVLSMIAVRAKAERLGPRDLTPAWVAGLLARTREPALKATRSACYLLDDLRDDARIPADLLPPVGTGVERRYAKHRQT